MYTVVRKQGSEIKWAAGRRLRQLQAQLDSWNRELEQLQPAHSWNEDKRTIFAQESAEGKADAGSLWWHRAWLEQEIRRLSRLVTQLDDKTSLELTINELLNYGFGMPLDLGD